MRLRVVVLYSIDIYLIANDLFKVLIFSFMQKKNVYRFAKKQKQGKVLQHSYSTLGCAMSLKLMVTG